MIPVGGWIRPGARLEAGDVEQLAAEAPALYSSVTVLSPVLTTHMCAPSNAISRRGRRLAAGSPLKAIGVR